MSEYLDIVEEKDDYRVRLEYDDSGEKPYDEGAVPILSREFRGYGRRWEAVNDAADEYTGLLNTLEERFDEEEIERFLRIFLGAYSVMWDSSQDYRYLAFDTEEWRTKHGLTDEYLDRVFVTPELDRSKLAEGSLTEIMAWATGEVYGYIVERSYQTAGYENDEPSWEAVPDGSCWGFYGRDYAEESAKEALKEVMSRK